MYDTARKDSGGGGGEREREREREYSWGGESVRRPTGTN